MARAYKLNPAGFRKIALGPEVRKALAEVAEKGKAYAEAISADFSDVAEDRDPNDVYAKSFQVVPLSIIWGGEFPGPRAAAQLQNTSGHAAAVEWGYHGRSGEPSTSAHRVLGRTLEYLEAEGRS